ncbi:ASCH domain-containing protein [Aeromicrobium sp. CF4.19]|uniref:ASCH domain-containing protein n=1 Tax=Aeromicrobium sp. CF4.19 TaxID=3373082 RepID=UPI003EE72FF0
MTDLWADYVDASPEQAEALPARGPFGDSPALADELLALVLAGGKRATSGPPDPDEPVTVGGHWVVSDGSDRERVILRTTEVRAGRLDSVDDRFAADEGEGDLSRGYWLQEHRTFVRRVLGLSATTDVDDVEMIFERFRVVWPPEHADALD